MQIQEKSFQVVREKVKNFLYCLSPEEKISENVSFMLNLLHGS